MCDSVIWAADYFWGPANGIWNVDIAAYQQGGGTGGEMQSDHPREHVTLGKKCE